MTINILHDFKMKRRIDLLKYFKKGSEESKYTNLQIKFNT